MMKRNRGSRILSREAPCADEMDGGRHNNSRANSRKVRLRRQLTRGLSLNR